MNNKSDTNRLAEAVANIGTTITEIIELKIRELAEAAKPGEPVCGAAAPAKWKNRTTPIRTAQAANNDMAVVIPRANRRRVNPAKDASSAGKHPAAPAKTRRGAS